MKKLQKNASCIGTSSLSKAFETFMCIAVGYVGVCVHTSFGSQWMYRNVNFFSFFPVLHLRRNSAAINKLFQNDRTNTPEPHELKLRWGSENVFKLFNFRMIEENKKFWHCMNVALYEVHIANKVFWFTNESIWWKWCTCAFWIMFFSTFPLFFLSFNASNRIVVVFIEMLVSDKKDAHTHFYVWLWRKMKENVNQTQIDKSKKHDKIAKECKCQRIKIEKENACIEMTLFIHFLMILLFVFIRFIFFTFFLFFRDVCSKLLCLFLTYIFNILFVNV